VRPGPGRSREKKGNKLKIGLLNHLPPQHTQPLAAFLSRKEIITTTANSLHVLFEIIDKLSQYFTNNSLAESFETSASLDSRSSLQLDNSDCKARVAIEPFYLVIDLLTKCIICNNFVFDLEKTSII